MRKYRSGFTLVELMVVVAIVAILAAVAYPSYTQQILRSRRTEGRAALMQNAQTLEKCFTVTGSYVGCNGLMTTSTNNYYTIPAPVAGATGDLATSYSMTASAAGAQTSDAYCTTLTIDSTGARTSTGTRPADADCWSK